MAKIGIYGGTFNPIHNTHLNIAQNAKLQYGLDQIVFIPAGDPPHKCLDSLSTAFDRINMIEIATKGLSGYSVDLREIERSGKSYTYLTLLEYNDQHPEDELFFIMGSDSLDYFDQWKNPDLISSLATVLVAMREGDEKAVIADKMSDFESKFSGKFRFVEVETSSTASSTIREELVLESVPEGVAEYINYHGLYKPSFTYDDVTNILDKVKDEIKHKRFLHTIGVAHTAANLSMRWNYPVNKAMIAGALHDCAKQMSDKELIDICNRKNISITDSELICPQLLHGKVAAIISPKKYNISDEDILHAISVHTTGCENMNLLDKIIFVSDYIEPGRDKAPRLEYLRQLAFKDLDLCCYEICHDTIEYLKENPKSMDPATINTFNYFANLLGKENYGN